MEEGNIVDSGEMQAGEPMGKHGNQEPNWGTVLLVLVGLTVAGAIIGAFVLVGLSRGFNWPEAAMSGRLAADAAPELRWPVRGVLGLNHLFTFLLPGFATVYILYRTYRQGLIPKTWLDYLDVRKWPSWRLIGWSVLGMVLIAPLVVFLYQINQLIPLPDGLQFMEEQTEEAIKGLMQMDTPWELLANLLVVALLPAIGEELVFRGILQKQLGRFMLRPWHAILLAAAIFSFIHMQFGGFLPRWLLGIVLGWLYWRTGNLWVSIIAHFFNNGIQVVAQYLFAQQISSIDLNEDPNVPWYAALISVILVYLVYIQFEKAASKSTGTSGNQAIEEQEE